MEALEAESIIEGLPPQAEALRVAREWARAEWWIQPQRKPRLQEPERFYSGKLRSWAVRVARDALGHRVVQARRAFGSGVALAIIKARSREGKHRLLLPVVAGFERVRIMGKRLVPVMSMILYASMNGKNASPLDPLMPRMRRTFRARGYAWAAYRLDITQGGSGHRNLLETILGGPLELGADRRAVRIGHRSYEVRSLRSPSVERVQWREYVQCETMETLIVEEQSKWVLPLPPLLLWKWHYHVRLEPIVRAPSEPLCEAFSG